MTRTKALLAGTALAAATALSAAAVTAAPAGNGPASADAPRGQGHHGIHKARGEGKGWGHRHGRGDHCKRGSRHMERRVDLIEGLMTFTPEQEAAWKELKTSMENGRETIEKACEARKEEGRPKTALERFNRFEEGMATRLSVMRATKPAFEKFYGTLSEKQQKAVDNLFTRKGRRG
jgi:hypothetical protein